MGCWFRRKQLNIDGFREVGIVAANRQNSADLRTTNPEQSAMKLPCRSFTNPADNSVINASTTNHGVWKGLKWIIRWMEEDVLTDEQTRRDILHFQCIGSFPDEWSDTTAPNCLNPSERGIPHSKEQSIPWEQTESTYRWPQAAYRDTMSFLEPNQCVEMREEGWIDENITVYVPIVLGTEAPL